MGLCGALRFRMGSWPKASGPVFPRALRSCAGFMFHAWARHAGFNVDGTHWGGCGASRRDGEAQHSVAQQSTRQVQSELHPRPSHSVTHLPKHDSNSRSQSADREIPCPEPIAYILLPLSPARLFADVARHTVLAPSRDLSQVQPGDPSRLTKL